MIVAALAGSAELDGRSVTVHASDDGLVRLEGAVRTWQEREAAERVAWQAPGVTAVVDDLDVRP